MTYILEIGGRRRLEGVSAFSTTQAGGPRAVLWAQPTTSDSHPGPVATCGLSYRPCGDGFTSGTSRC